MKKIRINKVEDKRWNETQQPTKESEIIRARKPIDQFVIGSGFLNHTSSKDSWFKKVRRVSINIILPGQVKKH
jgi:hypothetical protein